MTARGLRADTIRVDLGPVDRAVLGGDDEGFLKVTHVRGGDRILGATLVSRHAGETISEPSVALAAGAGLAALSSVVHPYPTHAEVVRRAGDECNRRRLTPRVESLRRSFLSWRR